MSVANITLWSVSISLALIGILFGIIASYNSKKANEAVRELVEDSLIAEESNNIFFTNLKALIASNKQTLILLEEKPSWRNYGLAASNTRLSPIPGRIQNVFNESEFKELTGHYLELKKEFEDKFQEIVPNYKVLSTANKVSPAKKEALIKYHKLINRKVSKLITEYINTQHK